MRTPAFSRWRRTLSAAFSGVILVVLAGGSVRPVPFASVDRVTVVASAVAAVLWIFSFFPLLGFLYEMLLRIMQVLLFLYWLFLLWQAHKGRWYRIPTSGPGWSDR